MVFNKRRIWRLLGPDLAAVNLEKQFDRLSVSFRRNEKLKSKRFFLSSTVAKTICRLNMID